MSMLEDYLTQNLQDLPNQETNHPVGPLHRRRSHGYSGAKHCLPCRQKNAADFLHGNTPGVMAFYAPEEQCRATLMQQQHPCPQPANLRANTRPDNATIEDAETVRRLVEWREEATY